MTRLENKKLHKHPGPPVESVNILKSSGTRWYRRFLDEFFLDIPMISTHGHLVGGIPTILKNITVVNGKDYPIYYGKENMLETKPPTSIIYPIASVWTYRHTQELFSLAPNGNLKHPTVTASVCGSSLWKEMISTSENQRWPAWGAGNQQKKSTDKIVIPSGKLT